MNTYNRAIILQSIVEYINEDSYNLNEEVSYDNLTERYEPVSSTIESQMNNVLANNILAMLEVICDTSVVFLVKSDTVLAKYISRSTQEVTLEIEYQWKSRRIVVTSKVGKITLAISNPQVLLYTLSSYNIKLHR